MAGVLIHKKVINLTKVDKDQDHLDVMHFSLSQYVGDRTEYLLELKKPSHEQNELIVANNPGNGMGQIAKALSEAAKALNTTAVVGVSCNTFHAPVIFDAFLADIEAINAALPANTADNGKLEVVHMIEATMKYIQDEMKLSKVGLMSTTGTRKIGVYREIAQKVGVEIVEVDEKYQGELHHDIYNDKDGIKKLSKASERVRANFEGYVQMLKEKGAKAVILGCTEIPIVFPEEQEFDGVKLIDPMDVLAQQLCLKGSKLN